jgi:hypothetical protein
MLRLLLAAVFVALTAAVMPVATPETLNNELPAQIEQPEPPQAQESLPSDAPQVEPAAVVLQEPETPAIGCHHYADLIDRYEWNTNVMLKICVCESSGNPHAIGDGHLTYKVGATVYGYSVGLLQVRYLPGREHYGNLQDPSTNIAAAYDIWKRQGYNAWTCYRKIGTGDKTRPSVGIDGGVAAYCHSKNSILSVHGRRANGRNHVTRSTLANRP